MSTKATQNRSAPTPAQPAPASAREFPKVVYHKKHGAKKVVDADDEAAHKLKGFSNDPPVEIAPAEE